MHQETRKLPQRIPDTIGVKASKGCHDALGFGQVTCVRNVRTSVWLLPVVQAVSEGTIEGRMDGNGQKGEEGEGRKRGRD